MEKYDHVILTCHSDAALKILKAGGKTHGAGGITKQEEEILGMFQWISNECVLHSDERVTPPFHLHIYGSKKSLAYAPE